MILWLHNNPSYHPPSLSPPAVPLSHTVEDFWKMVWQEKATCLVLLTVGREEGYSRPGDRYCPDGQETWCIGSFLVTTTFKKEYAHHILRYITIQV